MGNPSSFSSGMASNSVTSSALNVQANTPAQKRALSYASTIKQLFDEIQSSKMPADRILANYFREHKNTAQRIVKSFVNPYLVYSAGGGGFSD